MLGDGSKPLIQNNSEDPHTSILHLEAELHKQSESCEKMSLSLKQGEVDLKRKDEEIIQQKNKVIYLFIEEISRISQNIVVSQTFRIACLLSFSVIIN